MKILTAAEMRAADEATFTTIGVPSRAVMESAGRHAAVFISDHFGARLSDGVLVVCGPGNNGGDGYVIARALGNLGVRVSALAVKPLAALKGDARAAADAFAASGGAVLDYSSSREQSLRSERWGVLVDAIFGTGISGEVKGDAAAAIDFINSFAATSKIPVVAIDIPSGVDSETGIVCGRAVSATATVAIQCLKLGHVLFPAAESCGEVWLADVGIGASLPEISAVRRELVTSNRVLGYLTESRATKRDAHKGRRGHVLVLGGAAGKFGAPQLSGQSALQAGAGLVTLGLPESAARESISSLKELMCEGLPDENGSFGPDAAKRLAKLSTGKDAIVIGPGMGEGSGAAVLLSESFVVSKKDKLGVVIDADALNLLASHPQILKALPENAVLTPHPGEMSRLTGKTIDEVQSDRLSVAAEFSRKHRCVTVLKGARTVIADPSGAIFINPAATAVLGTAGSGDSLAGIIGALIGQGVAPAHAAVAGVYVHGVAGEVLERRGGVFGVVASDISVQAAAVLNALNARSDIPPKTFLVRALPDAWLPVV